MAAAMVRWLLLLLLFSTSVLAQPPKVVLPEPLKVPPRSLDDFKLPAGTIVVIGDGKDALKNVDAIVLSPEEYKKLLDTIDQLRKQTNADKPEIPGVCRLTLQLRDAVVRVRATYEFRTSAPRSLVTLGFRQANAVAAHIDDDQAPVLQVGNDGYRVLVETPGTHQLALDLELPLQVRGSARAAHYFAVQLPGAAITLLEGFALPAGVTAARVKPMMSAGLSPAKVREFSKAVLQKLSAEQPAAMGPADGVEFSWDAPVASKPVESLLSAEGQVTVHVSEKLVETAAKLHLKSQRGPIREWLLRTPPNAEVRVTAPTGPMEPEVKAANSDKSQWRIGIPEPGSQEVQIEALVRTARGAAAAPIGPFVVPGAFPQRGTIAVFAPDNIRPRFSKFRGDVRPAASDGNDAPTSPAATFTYGNSALNDSAASAPLLSVSAEMLRGQIRTQVSHQLRWNERGWRWSAAIKATPIRTEFDQLEIELPAGLEDVQSPSEPVVEIVPTGNANRWRIRLDKPQRREITLQLDGVYPIAPNVQEAQLQLPRVRQTNERDSNITVIVPKGKAVRGSVREWEGERVSEWSRPLELVAPVDRFDTLGFAATQSLAQIELRWAPIQIELPISSAVDVHVDEHRAAIRHQLTLPASTSSRALLLRAMPGLLPAGVRALGGGALTGQDDSWTLTIPAGQTTAVVSYICSLRSEDGADGKRVDLGLLWPMNATACETRLRFWSRTSVVAWRPKLVAGPWEELPIEPVSGRSSLPILVLHGSGLSLPLSLGLAPAIGLTQPAALVERVFVQVATNGGQQDYRIRLNLRQVTTPTLQLELPAPPAVINLDARLDGTRIDQVFVRDESGRPASAADGRFVEIPLAAKAGAQVLELRYQLSAVRRIARWEHVLLPPKVRGAAFVGEVRWQIGFPADDVLFSTHWNSRLEQRWAWRRFLFVPEPAYGGAELEQWFANGSASLAADANEPAAWNAGAVLIAPALESTSLVSIPRSMWLLVCSLTALSIGLTLLFVRRITWLFWFIVAGVAVAIGAAALVWPQATVTALVGSPLGLAVLLIVVLLQWLLRQRYERRVVFMPGFSRRSSSVARASSNSKLQRREPSTVDAPPAG